MWESMSSPIFKKPPEKSGGFFVRNTSLELLICSILIKSQRLNEKLLY
jgi:hypothetical protein